MAFPLIGVIGALFGANPLKTATDALNQAHRDKLTAANDSERIDADRRIRMGDQQVAILQEATKVRLATASYPEQRLLAFLAGGCAVFHWVAIAVGTTIVAPHAVNGVFRGPWFLAWLEWTLRIPPFPPPFDDYEGAIILSFFGLVGAVSVGKSIAGALALRGVASSRRRDLD